MKSEPSHISTTLVANEVDRSELKKKYREWETGRWPDLPGEEADQFVAAYAKRVDGSLVGGVEGNVYWEGVEIEYVWVADELRRTGIGTQLMLEVEKAAVQAGARIAYLRTALATSFYQSLGYHVFGVLEDRPTGHKMYFMKKKL